MSMSYVLSPRPDPGLSARLFMALADLVRRMAQAYRHRREVALLLDADHRVLADLGITAGDVRSALASPFPVDPGSRLALLAAERRVAAWSTARELAFMKRFADDGRADAA